MKALKSEEAFLTCVSQPVLRVRREAGLLAVVDDLYRKLSRVLFSSIVLYAGP